MDIKEVMQAFRDETPVRMGDLVFSRIESIIYKLARFNQYIESSTIDGVNTGLRVPTTLKIIQAACSDLHGHEYVLNPTRLEPATPDEINVWCAENHILADRLKLLEVFAAYCKEENIAPNLEGLILFLFAEDLINPCKAYDVVRAYERSEGKKPS